MVVFSESGQTVPLARGVYEVDMQFDGIRLFLLVTSSGVEYLQRVHRAFDDGETELATGLTRILTAVDPLPPGSVAERPCVRTLPTGAQLRLRP